MHAYRGQLRKLDIPTADLGLKRNSAAIITCGNTVSRSSCVNIIWSSHNNIQVEPSYNVGEPDYSTRVHGQNITEVRRGRTRASENAFNP
jgi:hypothetical protein